MSDIPERFATITALHQQVREFVEAEFKDHYVERIEGQTLTTYELPLGEICNPIHALVTPTFQVYLRNPLRSILCTVHVDSAGEFRLGGVQRKIDL